MRMDNMCPGSDGRSLKAEERQCPTCSNIVELFSDEGSVKCRKCGTVVKRGAPLVCSEWCSHADSCAAARAARAAGNATKTDSQS